MNFHPGMLGQAPFLDKPLSLNVLNHVVGLIEGKIAVVPERQRMEGV
jgi:hypothetical protein